MEKDSHYIAMPESGPSPGVVVLHSWWGLNPFFKALCDRFAREGFVAVAPDLYMGETASTEDEARQLRARMTATRREPAYKILKKSICSLSRDVAVVSPDIAVVGFSMGGHWALWLAQQPDLPIYSTVVFYAVRNGDFRCSNSKFLFHFAENDEWVSASGKRKVKRSLEAAGREASYFEYPGTKHWFFESDRPEAFNQDAADVAWSRTLGFLRDQG